MYCWSLTWRILSVFLLACEMSAIICLQYWLHGLCNIWYKKMLFKEAEGKSAHCNSCVLPIVFVLTAFKITLLFTKVHWWQGDFSSVAQSCPTLCDPMNHSMPGLHVHHQLPEFTQTHGHLVGDTIQPSHLLSSPSPPAPNPSQHQGLFQWVNSSHEVAKVLKCQLQHQSLQWTPRTDFL